MKHLKAADKLINFHLIILSVFSVRPVIYRFAFPLPQHSLRLITVSIAIPNWRRPPNHNIRRGKVGKERKNAMGPGRKCPSSSSSNNIKLKTKPWRSQDAEEEEAKTQKKEKNKKEEKENVLII